MKIIRFFSFLLVFQAFALMASSQNSPKADKILKDSRAKFDGLGDFTANFTYTMNNPKMQKAIIKNGEMKIKKAKYKVLFQDEEFYCDGKKVWVFMKPENEVTVSQFDPSESMSVDRVYKIYDGNSKTKYEGEDSQRHRITIFITDENSDIWKAEVWIGKQSQMVEKGVLFGRNGSQYQYELKNIKTNTGVTDSEFVFDKAKHPGVYVNDLD